MGVALRRRDSEILQGGYDKMESAQQVIKEFRDHIQKTSDAMKGDLAKVRTGRTSVSILDNVRVECYGSQMPLNQVSTLSVPENRLIVIQPWDVTVIPAIEKAILASGLGLTPGNDGKVIRLPIPALTEERRQELVKHVHKLGEEGKISVRQSRKIANESMKKLEKDKKVSEDDSRRSLEQIQKLTDEAIAVLDQLIAKKEKELLTL